MVWVLFLHLTKKLFRNHFLRHGDEFRIQRTGRRNDDLVILRNVGSSSHEAIDLANRHDHFVTVDIGRRAVDTRLMTIENLGEGANDDVAVLIHHVTACFDGVGIP